MGLRFAAEGGKRLPLGEDWIEVRQEISKGTFRAIMQSMPQKELDTSKGKGQSLRLTQGEAVDYQVALFQSLVIGWSLPAEATVENYLRLDQESGNAVDAALAEHFTQLTPSTDELVKASTSPGKRQKG
jgi:hypothetical protein